MSRLFITPREIDFISDVTKEVIKDVVGQKIYYYRVREDLTQIHDVYEEAENKVFDPPVIIDARIEWEPTVITTNRFGGEELYSINIFLHERDLLDRNIDPQQGDFFSYGDTFFEITSAVIESTVYGEIEHSVGLKLVGKQSRIGLIDRIPNGPTSEAYTDPGAVQEVFAQQRGFVDNQLGKTDDVRSLQERGVVTKPISGPAEVAPVGGNHTKNEIGTTDSSFYADS
tara:strand:+ start:1088 stop:1771 length:684 start_codon:yes stop_codon:yes gene_type:complete